MDPFRQIPMTRSLPCAMFVPTAKDGRVCAVCRFAAGQHPPSRPAKLLNRSENSAFSQFHKMSHRNSAGESTSESSFVSDESSRSSSPVQFSVENKDSGIDINSYPLQRCATFSNQPMPRGHLHRPKPRILHPTSSLTTSSPAIVNYRIPIVNYRTPIVSGQIQVHEPSSQMQRRIKQKQNWQRPQRSASTDDRGQLVVSSISSRSSSPSPPFNAPTTTIETTREPVLRAVNFKQILDRFQKASEHHMDSDHVRIRQRGDPNRRFTVDAVQLLAPAIDSITITAPIESTESNDDSEQLAIAPRSPLIINVPTANIRRGRLPDRWTTVKETAIDEGTSSRSTSPNGGDERIEPAVNKNNGSSDLMHRFKQVLERLERHSPEQWDSGIESRASNQRKTQSKLGGSCRKIIHPNARHAQELPSARLRAARLFVRHNSPSISNEDRSRPHSVISEPSPRSGTNRSPFISSIVQSTNGDDTLRQREIENRYNQMALSHVNTLAFVTDHLSEMCRERNHSIGREQKRRLNFSDFILTSNNPRLVKGRTLFFDAHLPRPGQSALPVTLMIAKASQYAPLGLLRRTVDGCPFSAPAIFELEDVGGEVDRLLRGDLPRFRSCRVVVMHRMKNLCSFHSLAAQHLDHGTIDPARHEKHVCFIMIQLLTALKYLQSDGVEHLSINFKEFLLAYANVEEERGDEEQWPQVIVLQETIADDSEDTKGPDVAICRYALRALCTLLHQKMDNKVPPIKMRSDYSTALLRAAELLHRERASSLTEARNVLEICFWAERNGALSIIGGEFEAKLWLDTERAMMVNRLVRLLMSDAIQLNIADRYRIQFLLSATPRSLCQARHLFIASSF